MIETKFKVIPVNGIMPIIVDYCNYKITVLMHNGVTVKFFKFHDNRWYKIKETHWDYFKIDECINWAKSLIDNDETGYFDMLLKKQITLKAK
jgi:hypothetical protein